MGQGMSGCKAEVHNSRKNKPKRTRNCRGSSRERGRTRTSCGRQAEKIRFGWRPGRNDLGCPVEKTGYVTTTMFQGNQLLLRGYYLDFGTYSSWHITSFVGIILYRLNVFFHLGFSLCSISCANLSLVFFSAAFSKLSCADFGPKKVYAELLNVCRSSGLKY